MELHSSLFFNYCKRRTVLLVDEVKEYAWLNTPLLNSKVIIITLIICKLEWLRTNCVQSVQGLPDGVRTTILRALRSHGPQREAGNTLSTSALLYICAPITFHGVVFVGGKLGVGQCHLQGICNTNSTVEQRSWLSIIVGIH
jgi:hypothetical protein